MCPTHAGHAQVVRLDQDVSLIRTLIARTLDIAVGSLDILRRPVSAARIRINSLSDPILPDPDTYCA